MKIDEVMGDDVNDGYRPAKLATEENEIMVVTWMMVWSCSELFHSR
jgi:hypothetical protein